MKKIILGLLLVCGFASANAQKGTWLLFGNLGFNNTKSEFDTKTIDWTVNPGIGYQVTNNWAVGLNLYWNQHSTSDVPGGSAMTTVNSGKFGVFARYTENIGKGPFFYYGHIDALYTEGYTTDSSAPAFNKHNGITIAAYPAIGMWVGRCWGINMSFGGISYVTDKQTTDASATTIPSPKTASTLDINFGHQVNVGVLIKLGCCKDGKKGGKHKESKKASKKRR